MSRGFFEKNWKWLAALAGMGIITRQLVQHWRAIDLQDKVVLITGGSRGLGLAIAEEFAKEGARLALCARNKDELARARMILAEFGADVIAVTCDVSDPKQVHKMVEQVTEHYRRIDILVNNAGIISVGPWQSMTREDFEESMNVMFWGTYNTTTAVLPQMRERHAGHIVNIASIGGKVSVPHLLSYSTAKFAIVGFSEGLHVELAQDGIDVTTVAPGLMRTGSPRNALVKGKQHKLEYTMFKLLDTLPIFATSAERAARRIVKATKIGQTELIISIQAQLLARLHGLLPGLTTDVLTINNRWLPGGEGAGSKRYRGQDSETVLSKSWWADLGKQAEQDYNE